MGPSGSEGDSVLTFLLKFAILVAFIFSLGLLGSAIRRRFTRRTLSRWGGWGVERDLSPEKAAILTAQHPATTFLLLVHRLSEEGLARLESLHPARLVWLGGTPRNTVEEAVAAAAGGEPLRIDGALSALEALWRELDDEFRGRSGPASSRHYRRLVRVMWDEASAGGDLPKGAEAWLVMAESLEVWDRMGSGPGWDRLRELFRMKEQVREHLFPEEALSDRAARAENGYLAWRQDLVVVPHAAG